MYCFAKNLINLSAFSSVHTNKIDNSKSCYTKIWRWGKAPMYKRPQPPASAIKRKLVKLMRSVGKPRRRPIKTKQHLCALNANRHSWLTQRYGCEFILKLSKALRLENTVRLSKENVTKCTLMVDSAKFVACLSWLHFLKISFFKSKHFFYRSLQLYIYMSLANTRKVQIRQAVFLHSR